MFYLTCLIVASFLILTSSAGDVRGLIFGGMVNIIAVLTLFSGVRRDKLICPSINTSDAVSLKLEDPDKRMLRLLTENTGRYSIDKDGVVSTNWNHPAVQAEMRRQIEAIEKLWPVEMQHEKKVNSQ
ncbi:hypothetical protein D8682_26275 [Buttiauxella sp. 3AFRM03]|uniref:hypothetical protein n=1 Tax=Buttiauxella sp. 3AFRM03 TaxID=2479367 RepID=UPI000EF8470A|nr:hypothetical protein [Buttiauxella sp. 3AFRM03]AYN30179.1 hypothetical protein D8682_26275 [Buttiauxella sp. 3AFRM03]